MCAHNATKVVRRVKLPLTSSSLHHLQHLIHSEQAARAAWRLIPALPTRTLLRVAPQQVAHGAFVRHFLEAIERRDLRVNGGEKENLTEGGDERREPTVQAEDGVADKGADRNVVKQIGEIAPDDGGLVFAKTLLIKAIHLRNLTTLVVPTDNVDSVGISQLQKDHIQHSF